ncbi:hypothetical protein [Mesorhizobium marinum]|uniref:Uncharacterized protein n=1 Tax=Mesorhizobium marinum TaxID=3228790 RepID=A0ABV3R139_9HYPH
MIMYQLLRPLAYMSIRDDSKWKIDILLPMLFSILATCTIYALPVAPVIFGKDGVIQLLMGLFQILPGFYLTALAAVATFNRPDMDNLLPDPAPTVEVSVRGRSTKIELTRRRMLSMLFGYLTFLSFGIYFVSLAAQIGAPSVVAMTPAWLLWYVRCAFSVGFGFLLWQMIFITLFGLYQLSDRMHQPD